MDIIVKLFDKMSEIKAKDKKTNLIVDVVKNPERYKLLAYIEGEELRLTISKKD